MNQSTTLGTWLKQSRLERGLDLSSLASTSGVDRSTINRIERDVAQPTVCTAVRLCNGLQVRPEELVLALQGRQLESSLEPAGRQDDVLTAKDLASFVQVARIDPKRAHEMLAEWLDSLSRVYTATTNRNHDSGTVGSESSFQPSRFSRSFIDLLTSDLDFLRSEMQFPPQPDGRYILDLYERGGAITLRDVGAYIRWARQQQRKSLVEMKGHIGVSDSALSRIETGALEQIRLMDILGLDQELMADGRIIRMCWAACELFPPVVKHGATRKSDNDSESTWSEREYRLALTLLAIVRWWSYLQPGDTFLISKIHDGLKQSA